MGIDIEAYLEGYEEFKRKISSFWKEKTNNPNIEVDVRISLEDYIRIEQTEYICDLLHDISVGLNGLDILADIKESIDCLS